MTLFVGSNLVLHEVLHELEMVFGPQHVEHACFNGERIKNEPSRFGSSLARAEVELGF